MKLITFLPAFLIPFLLSAVSFAQKPYFQQRVDTRIDVTLDDVHHILRGLEEFTYVNNSPDTLKYLYIHLWPNAYSHDHTQFAEQQYRNGNKKFYYAKTSQRGSIDSLQFEVDGKEVMHFTAEPTPDIARIDLPQPLAPGGTIKVTTPFKVKVPIVFSRLGHTGQAYFISQWFPKPAVYDNRGWHPLPYLDNGEFYSEIGSYDVSITLPKNYVVMATGNLQNAEEEAWLDSLANVYENVDTSLTNAKKQDSLRKGKTTIARQGKDTVIASSTTFKTIRFTEDNIHDFAWFADKRWEVKKDTITQADGSVITTWAASLPSYRRSWSKGNEHLKNAVKYYGQWVGLYPYKTIKAVQGDMNAGGGMEYPTVTVIDRTVGGSADVIIHEAGHNWFYGILASNERDHAWMDEGLNTFYEQKTSIATKEIKKDSTNKASKRGEVSVNLDMKSIIHQLQASGKDEAIDQTSNNMPEINYGLDVYYKTASLLEWLETYMGKDTFQTAMQDYFNTWKHRHPYPEDFRAVMEKHTNKPIDWFFQQLQTDRPVDFAIKGVDQNNGNVAITVKNKTGESLPVAVGLYKDDSLLTQAVSMPFTGKTTLTLNNADGWNKARILPTVFDAITPNNTYRRSGLFHRSGLAIRPGAGLTTGEKQKLFFLPALGYNYYDGFMAGLLLHNLTWPQHKFQFVLAPMYAFRSKEFVGAGSIGYSWHPRRTFEEIHLQGDIKSFHFDEAGHYYDGLLFKRYTKLAPSLEFTFKERLGTSPIKRRLLLKGYAIQEDNFAFDEDILDTNSIKRQLPRISDATTNFYGLIRYTHQNNRPFNPFSYIAEAQMGEFFAKLSLEGNLRIDYNKPKKSLYIRAFIGKFFELNNDGPNASRYYLNSTFRGENDYLYDDTYIGRSEQEGFSSKQISIREGGMKIATPMLAASALGTLGRSDNWLAAVNLKTDLPIKLPIRLWVDASTFANAKDLNPSGNKILYAGGAEIYFRDIINIYVPFVMSRDYNDYTKSFYPDNRFLNTITFTIQLQNINWLKLPSKIFSIAGY